ncbi:MAG: hypothetical protein DRJ50_02965 [Actinobacteria bacterium]|nr:MAG: hypothetical protein DRJ50_02965 [Actinomycetota bacterium]
MTAVGNASIVCLQDATVIESNGLPDHEVMVGIEAGGWNGQWPTAQDYTGECGAYVSADGLIHYAFTDEYPYVTQCLLGAYEEGPRTSGAETDTGGYSSEELGSITGYEVRDDGCQVMTFASGIELVHCDDH